MKVFTYENGNFHFVSDIPYGLKWALDGMLVTPERTYYVLVRNRAGQWFTGDRKERVDLVSVHAGGEVRWRVEVWQIANRPLYKSAVDHFGLVPAV